jgi:hypothetical protein
VDKQDTDVVVLDPNDPFDAALIPIVRTNRKKRADYALDGDPFSNFKETSAALGVPGFGPVEAALFNVLQKLARLKSLRANGRMNDTANEAVADTYLDLAVYAVIVLALGNGQQARTGDEAALRAEFQAHLRDAAVSMYRTDDTLMAA